MGINEISEIPPREFEMPQFQTFGNSQVCDVTAVDSGIIRLGETETGLFIALRGAIVKCSTVLCEVSLYKTGPFFLSFERKTECLFQLGIDLLEPEIFVELDDTNQNEEPRLIRTKSGVADTSHEFADRFRNWFERMLQLLAIENTTNGVVVLDGALTLRTRDTPSAFLSYLSSRANSKRNSLIAVSKQSDLQVQNKSIQFWLDDRQHQSGYRCLSNLLSSERRNRIMGSLYAARFTPYGPTFRMDVRPMDGQRNEEAINSFYSNSLMKAGYPDLLVRAHACSYFSFGDVVTLQSQIRANYQIIPRLETNLTPIFAPFGGRFK
jgi:hypothetical protein